LSVGGEADRMVEALHSGSDELVPLVKGLTTEQLTEPSAAAEWDLSQVLGHLGSGAVITQAVLESSLSGVPRAADANQAVWARWDAMSPQERADGFLAANAELLARYDGLDAATRESLRVDMGFLPAPVDLATAARFRLSEFALHSWDVRVALDPKATVHADAVPLLLGQIGFVLGWLAKPAPLGGRTVSLLVRLTDLDRSFGVTLGESSSIGDVPTEPDAVLTTPAEAWLRLAGGRLAPEHTPPGVEVTAGTAGTAAIDLDTLRAVFPGY
jgi:uncharacterized protein (TIGR03083 family)